MKTFKAWVGFTDDDMHNEYRDDYGLLRGIQIFETRGEAKQRFEDVRRVFVTINEVRKRKRK